MFSRSPWDWGLLFAYLAFLIWIWARRGSRGAGPLEYLVAGRRITLPAFVASLVATWYGGILGIGEYSWRHGVSNWLVFGVPYYVGALLFAWWFAARARQRALFTIPDLLAQQYGRGPALMGALTVFITAAPAAYVLMLGTLLASMFQLPLAPCVVAAALFSCLYVYTGGLRNAVLADKVYFVLMFLGFAVLLGFLVAAHGGLSFLNNALPPTHFTWHGGNSAGAILVWYFIALSALVDPAFWQSAYSAENPAVARRGVMISVVCWMVFDFLTTSSGLYARALLPDLREPVFAFPELAKITLPPFALGLFYLGLIATVMSTIDSYTFIAAATLGRDVIWRLRGDPDESKVPSFARVGLIASALFAVVLALSQPSVIALWHDIGSITTPTLLLPVALALFGRARPAGRRLTASWALTAMIVPFVVALAWVLVRRLEPDAAQRMPWTIEPIYVGLAASVASCVTGWLLDPRRPAVTSSAGPTDSSARR